MPTSVKRKLGMAATAMLLALALTAGGLFFRTKEASAGYWNYGNYRLNSWETQAMAQWDGSLGHLTEATNTVLGAFANARGYSTAGWLLIALPFLYYGILNYWKWVAGHVHSGNCLTINYSGFAFIERCT